MILILHDYYDSLDGVSERRKVRLRSYGPGQQEYFEEKAKNNQQITKFCLKRKELDQHPKRLYLCNRQPVIKIVYEREAFEVPEIGLRLTFDDCLSVRRASPDAPWYSLLPNRVIFECKHAGVYPPWLSQLIRSYQLECLRLSKYCMAVQACDIV